MSALDRFCELLLDDDELRATLDVDGQDPFIARVVEVAAARGFTLDPAEVRARMSAHQRGWLERWM